MSRAGSDIMLPVDFRGELCDCASGLQAAVDASGTI